MDFLPQSLNLDFVLIGIVYSLYLFFKYTMSTEWILYTMTMLEKLAFVDQKCHRNDENLWAVAVRLENSA